jgi:hypothetical protein
MGFQPQNYALDFMQGMQIASSMIDRKRELDLAERKYTDDSVLKRSAEARAQGSYITEQEGARIRNEKGNLELETEKINKKNMDYMRQIYSMPFDLNGVDIPDDPSKAKMYGDAHAAVNRGVTWFKNAIAQSGQDMIITVNDIPSLPKEMQAQVQSTLNAYNILTDSKSVGKTFTEPETGRTYTTRTVGGMMGTKRNTMVPLYLATYDDNPKEVKFVPATVNATNTGDDLLAERPFDTVIARTEALGPMLQAAAAATNVKSKEDLKAFGEKWKDELVFAGLRKTDPLNAEKKIAELQDSRAAMRIRQIGLTEKESEQKAAKAFAETTFKFAPGQTAQEAIDAMRTYAKENPNDPRFVDLKNPEVMFAYSKMIKDEHKRQLDITHIEGKEGREERSTAAQELTADASMIRAQREPAGGADKLPTEAKLIQFYVSHGYPFEVAEQKAKQAKSDPTGQIAKMVHDSKQAQKDLSPTDPAYRTDAELTANAVTQFNEIQQQVQGGGQVQTSGTSTADVTSLRDFFTRNASRPKSELIAGAQGKGWTDDQIREAQRPANKPASTRAGVQGGAAVDDSIYQHSTVKQPAAAKGTNKQPADVDAEAQAAIMKVNQLPNLTQQQKQARINAIQAMRNQMLSGRR